MTVCCTWQPCYCSVACVKGEGGCGCGGGRRGHHLTKLTFYSSLHQTGILTSSPNWSLSPCLWQTAMLPPPQPAAVLVQLWYNSTILLSPGEGGKGGRQFYRSSAVFPFTHTHSWKGHIQLQIWTRIRAFVMFSTSFLSITASLVLQTSLRNVPISTTAQNPTWPLPTFPVSDLHYNLKTGQVSIAWRIISYN